LIYAAGSGTLILAAVGLLRSIRRIIERDAISELPVVILLWLGVAAWALAPYWGALRLHRMATSHRAANLIVGAAVVLLAALAANSFLATSAFVGGRSHPTADAMTIIIVPLVQWCALGAAAVMVRVLIRRAKRPPQNITLSE